MELSDTRSEIFEELALCLNTAWLNARNHFLEIFCILRVIRNKHYLLNQNNLPRGKQNKINQSSDISQCFKIGAIFTTLKVKFYYLSPRATSFY